MSKQHYSSTVDGTTAVVDLSESMILSPMENTRLIYPSITNTSSDFSEQLQVVKNRNLNDVVDLIDDDQDTDEIEMLQKPSFYVPSEKKARRLFKIDPNETNNLQQDSNLEPVCVNLTESNSLSKFVDLVDNENDDIVMIETVAPSTRMSEHDEIVMVKTIVPPKPLHDQDEIVMVKTIAPPKPEIQVLEVFPDADVKTVQLLLNGLNNNVAAAIEYMSQHKYKKSETVLSNQPPGLNLSVETDWMYDYTSINSFDPTQEYVVQAYELLLYDFPFLSKAGATCCMTKFRNHYALCYNSLFEAIKGDGDEDAQYNHVLKAMSRKPLSDDQKVRIQNVLPCRTPTIKTPIKRVMKVLITDSVLQNERKYVAGKTNEWMHAQQARRDRAVHKAISQRIGTAMECSCCFDSFPPDDMAYCEQKGHMFCLECVKSFTENLIFGIGNLGVDKRTKTLAIELQCFHGDGCFSGFSRAYLQKALPSKSLQKYDEVQCEISIKIAGLLEHMNSCPKCGFQAYVPQGQKVFDCPDAKCRYSSCTECGEAAHIPLRCDEVKKDKIVTKGRLTVEEAITAAKVRHCPSCKKSFIKESGCNKITCSCGIKVCYLCQKKINDYSHFCQKAHCTHKDCNGCPLYTKAEEDDLRAMREAGLAAAEQVKEANIDVNGILNAK